jgi:antagonist of KipI
MDLFSHRWANILVGNGVGAATLEVTLTGPELTFEDERLVSVTGAGFALTIDGMPVPHGEPLDVAAGACLRFGARHQGARAYVGIEGGIDVPVVLGSRSTHLPSHMGGWQGRALQAGDVLPLGSPAGTRRRSSVPRMDPVGPDSADPEPVVRILAGPDTDRFANDTLETLQRRAYRIDQDSNRMGYRLLGPALGLSRGADLISEATPIGTIQVPASGQPLLLMSDCQTTGGYPRVATAIRADLSVAGQAAPGDLVRFAVCTHEVALAALIARERPLLAHETARR